MIAQLVDIKIRANTGTQCQNDRQQFFIVIDLVDPRLFNIEHFAPKWQDGLVFAFTTILGRTTSGVTFDNEQFAEGGVFLLAIRQFAWQ